MNAEVLAKNGFIRAGETFIKVLGNGDLSRKFKVTASKLSASAKTKIEQAGGEVVVS